MIVIRERPGRRVVPGMIGVQSIGRPPVAATHRRWDG